MQKTQEKKIINRLTAKIILLAVASIITAASVKYQVLSYLSLFSLVIPIVLIFESKNLKHAALYGLVFGFVYYIFLNDWFLPLFKFSWEWLSIGWIISSIYLSLFTISTFILIKVIHRRFKNPVFIWLFIPLVWVGFEFMRMLGFLSFPFGAIGYSLIGTTFKKSASVWGWPGLSFLVVSTNIFLVLISGLVKKRQYKKIIPLLMLQVALLVSAYFVPSNVKYKPLIKVSAIKTDFKSVNKFQGQYEKNINIIYKLINKVKINNPSIVLIPETAFISFKTNMASTFPQVDNAVLGSFRQQGKKEYNSAFLLHKNKIMFVYDKRKLVLFGEYIPWRFIINSIPVLYKSLTPGTSNGLFVLDNEKAGIAICSESADSLQVKGLVDKGAGLLIVITNDEWFKGSSMPYQHFQLTKLRAIESGRYLIMAANGMPSAVFRPDGLFKASQGEGNGYVNSRVRYIYTKTVYDKLGWIIPYIAVIVIISISIVGLFKNRKTKIGM